MTMSRTLTWTATSNVAQDGPHLRALVSLVQPTLAACNARMWSSGPADARYAAWLGVSFDLVKATASLLAAALAEAARRQEVRLAQYFADQLREEIGHEQWVLEDYATIGGDPHDLVQRVPSPHAARLAGAQYYYLYHAQPLALLGHIAVLEWNAPAPGLANDLMRLTGFPRNAFRTLERHSDLDSDHGRMLDQVLADLALSDMQCQLLRTSALTTVYGLIELFDELGGPS